jgi:hypothetical protein
LGGGKLRRFLDRCRRFLRGELAPDEEPPDEPLDIAVWNAFAGYHDIYGKSPPASKVHRVRLWLAAQNEYEAEEATKAKQEQEEYKRKMPQH